ncbi:MAG: long-chain-acyl-CoA synthetase [Promethearchaeota archaeon]|nr:MAG: long-chain-acyl-CoA synthetase [Candidatus Lokiarchaeota archaeon]
MVKNSIPDTSNIIDKREYRKRRKALFNKHNDLIQKILDLPFDNKISWGTIVEENAEQYADKTAIMFEDTKLTYKDFNALVNRYTNYFLSLGLKKGDIVEVLLTNRTELLIIITATSKIGAISSLINTSLQGESLAYSINRTPGKFIIVGSELYNAFAEIKSALNLVDFEKYYLVQDRDIIPIPEGFIELSQVVNDIPDNNPPTTSSVKTMDSFAYVFTSGTTGFPKAAIRTHYGMVGAANSYGLLMAEMTHEDIVYIPLPFFHATALSVGWPAAFAGGASVAIGRKFSVRNFWDEIRKYDATIFTYVGEMCSYLMNQPPNLNDTNHRVRLIIGNGLRPEIWRDFKKRFNINFIGEFYGASEVPAIFVNLLNFDCTLGMCSSPYAIVKYDFQQEKAIRNENGFMERVNIGEVGLLLFESKGSTKFPGYVDKKATESKLFRDVFTKGDVWINTGDLIREQGCNHAQFFDRIGDTFRWKGHNVSTTEVEKIFNSYEQILISCVYGVKIPGTDGRAGMISIIPNTTEENFDFKALSKHLTKNMASYAIPIFLRFRTDLEQTSTLKLKKSKLKKEGFAFDNVSDHIYVMLPNNSEYTLLTKEIYEEIQDQNIKF